MDAARYQVRQLEGDVAAEGHTDEEVEVAEEVEVVEVDVEVEEETHPPSMVLIAVTSPVILPMKNLTRLDMKAVGTSRG